MMTVCLPNSVSGRAAGSNLFCARKSAGRAAGFIPAVHHLAPDSLRERAMNILAVSLLTAYPYPDSLPRTRTHNEIRQTTGRGPDGRKQRMIVSDFLCVAYVKATATRLSHRILDSLPERLAR